MLLKLVLSCVYLFVANSSSNKLVGEVLVSSVSVVGNKYLFHVADVIFVNLGHKRTS